jgi:hypothetical protein
MIELRMQCLKVASALKDVSSECVIDVADKMVRYVRGDATLPEFYNPKELMKGILDEVVSTINIEPDFMKR